MTIELVPPPPPTKPPAVMAEAGVTGLGHMNGCINEEWLLQLRGPKAAKTYREMADNSSLLGAHQLATEMLIRQVDWRIERAVDTPEARQIEDLCESARLDMETPWQDFISERMSMIPFGWDLSEELYKYRRGQTSDPSYSSAYDDNLIGWRGFAPRAQESLLRWEIDARGRTLGMYQQTGVGSGETYIPLEKALHLKVQSRKGNPEGRSLYRNAVRDWHALKRAQELELVGIYRDFAGEVVIRLPLELCSTSATAEQIALREKYETVASKLARNEYSGITFPSKTLSGGGDSGYDLYLLQSGGSRQINTSEVIKRIESRLLISVIAEFLLLGMEAHGSFALSDNKTNVFAMVLGGLLDGLCNAFNRTAIPRLCRLNGFLDPRQYPRLTRGDIETPELTQLANFCSQLIAANAMDVDDSLKKYLRRYADLPVPEPGVAGAASPAPAVVPPPGQAVEALPPAEPTPPAPA